MFKNSLLGFVITILALSLVNCNKNKCDLEASSIVASAVEITTIQNHLTANSLNATQHSSGLFYEITNAGSGDNPNLCSSVTVKYKGTLLNGSVFDESSSNVSFPLKQLIVGWQLGLPLLKKGGSIKLYVPPSLGYGSASQSGIPANSTLIFTIDLVDVVQ